MHFCKVEKTSVALLLMTWCLLPSDFSCWAISAVGAMEAALSIVYKKRALKLSIQIVTSCANSITIPGPLFANDNGCGMGDAADAIQFMSAFSIPQVGAFVIIS